jgi:hypothetical protein
LRRRVANPLIWRDIAKALDAGRLLISTQAGATTTAAMIDTTSDASRRRCRTRRSPPQPAVPLDDHPLSRGSEVPPIDDSSTLACGPRASEFGPPLQTLAPDEQQKRHSARRVASGA